MQKFKKISGDFAAILSLITVVLILRGFSLAHLTPLSLFTALAWYWRATGTRGWRMYVENFCVLIWGILTLMGIFLLIGL